MRKFYAFMLKGDNSEYVVQMTTESQSATEAIMVAQSIYGNDVHVEEVTNVDIQLPAVFRDGVFYNVVEEVKTNSDGTLTTTRIKETEAEKILTVDEQLSLLKSQNESLKEAIEMLVMDSVGGE